MPCDPKKLNKENEILTAIEGVVSSFFVEYDFSYKIRQESSAIPPGPFPVAIPMDAAFIESWMVGVISHRKKKFYSKIAKLRVFLKKGEILLTIDVVKDYAGLMGKFKERLGKEQKHYGIEFTEIEVIPHKYFV